MSMTYKSICNQQQTWARQRGIKFDENGYTFSLDDNLFFPFFPLLLEVRKEFQPSKGDELGSGGNRGKM